MRPGSLALCCVHVSWGEAVVKAVFSGVFINESVPIWVFLLLYFHIDSVPSYWDVFTQLSHPQNPALRGQTEKGSWARLPPAHRHPLRLSSTWGNSPGEQLTHRCGPRQDGAGGQNSRDLG